jgi:hypothetical protein
VSVTSTDEGTSAGAPSGGMPTGWSRLTVPASAGHCASPALSNLPNSPPRGSPRCSRVDLGIISHHQPASTCRAGEIPSGYPRGLTALRALLDAGVR